MEKSSGHLLSGEDQAIVRVSEGDTDSDSSGSEADVSCSRLVEFHKDWSTWPIYDIDMRTYNSIYGHALLSGLGPEHLKFRFGHYLVLAK